MFELPTLRPLFMAIRLDKNLFKNAHPGNFPLHGPAKLVSTGRCWHERAGVKRFIHDTNSDLP